MMCSEEVVVCFFFNDTATTEIYTLSLHDALPISGLLAPKKGPLAQSFHNCEGSAATAARKSSRASIGAPSGLASVFSTDRKSTRLNSSHANISYAVFCLKKKKHT